MGKNVIISTLPNISQNYLPKVNTSNIFANSLVYDDGSSVLINTTTASAFRLDVNGTGRFQGALTGTSATFTLANDITLTARSGAAGSYTYWSLGRTSSELELGVAAAANQFFTGTAAGDVIIKANGSSNKLMLGYGSGSPTLTLASTGAATFSSSVSVGAAIAGRLGVRGTTNDSSAYSFEAANSSGNTLFIVRNDGLSWFTGNVGIGTTSPDYLFTIDGKTGDASTVTLSRFYASKGQSGAAYLQIQGTRHPTASVRRMILDAYDGGGASVNLILQQSGGNVGIGTVTPSINLQISGTNNTANSSSMFWNFNFIGQEITNLSNTANTVAGLAFVGGSSRSAVSAIGGVLESTSLEALAFYTGGSGVGSGSVPERMRITSGGNVLIGTTDNTAAYRLNVAVNGGSAYMGVTNQAGGSGDRYLRIGFGTGATVASIQGTRVNVADDVNLALQPDGGNVGIGTADPRLKLTVNGAIGNGISAYPHNGKLVKAGTTSVTFTITLAYASNWNPAYATIRVAGSRTGLEEQYAAMYFLRLTYYAGSVSPVVYNVSGDTGNATVSVSASAPSNSVITITITDGGTSTNYLIADLDASFNTGILSIT